MDISLGKLETTSWVLVLATPLLCMWTPSLVIGRMPDNLAAGLIFTLLPAAPFLILSSFVHGKSRNGKSSAVVAGIISSLTAAVVSTLLFYIYFWRAVLTSIGFNFGAIFMFILSPVLISLVTFAAYGIGKACAQEK